MRVSTKIDKICEICSKPYQVFKVHAASRFCSRDCANQGQRTAERRDIVCHSCGSLFSGIKDHGAWPKFCGRACFCHDAAKPGPKECAGCGGVFIAGRAYHTGSADGLHTYCSTKCRSAGARTALQRVCLNCNLTFDIYPSKVAVSPEESCCSLKCRTAYYTEDRSLAWRGGIYTSESAGHAFVGLVRKGYIGKYIQEHRLIAGTIMGRPVERGEVVIHVNKDKSDNKGDNLFVCESMSEYAKRRNGSLPWPEKGNLKTAGRLLAVAKA